MRRLLCFLWVLYFLLVAGGCAAVAARVRPPQVTSQRLLLLNEEIRTSDAPAVTIKHNVWRQTYPVAGNTADEVRSALTLGKPFARGGESYEAQTQWNLHSTFRYDRTAAGCGLAAATIELEALVILPELIETPATEQQVIERWRAYRSALEGHEGGHVEMHLEAAR